MSCFRAGPLKISLRWSRRCLLMAWLTLAALGAGADHYLILSGSGGTEEYRRRFAGWSRRLEKVVAGYAGRDKPVVEILDESTGGKSADSAETISRELILRRLAQIAERVGPEDAFFLVLIGHGSHLKGVSKFQVPGPDLTAEDLKGALDSTGAARVVILNMTSASAGFINVLSAPGRIICTATKSVSERNATELMEFFLQGLEEGSADRNQDDRISLLEALRQADALTQAWFLSDGLLATEHALLDDNGDGLGTRLADVPDEPLLGETPDRPDASEATNRIDGDVARTIYLRDFSFPPSVPDELIDRYLGLMGEIEKLRKMKSEMEETPYYARLEQLLIDAAKTHRQIRAYAAAASRES